LWNKYGVAVAGILAPCANASCSNALDNDRVSGLAFPLPSVAVVGPGSINAGQGLRITLANADGAESNTQYAFDIDWDGNGQFEQTVGGRPGTQVNHTFATPGRYVVRVRFRHPSGRSDLATHAVQVLPTSNALAVFATTAARVGQQIDLVVAPTGASASQALTADAVGGMAPSLDITNPASAAQNFEYHMDWNGDGRTDELLVGPNGIAAQHVFGTSGVQNVRVLAVSDTGTQVLLQHAISVSPLPPSPSFSLVGPGLSVVGDEVVLAVNAANPLDPAWQTHRLVIDWNGDGIADLAVPEARRQHLRMVTFAGGEFTELERVENPQRIVTAVLPAHLDGSGRVAVVNG
jgi:hypothetical protein